MQAPHRLLVARRRVGRGLIGRFIAGRDLAGAHPTGAHPTGAHLICWHEAGGPQVRPLCAARAPGWCRPVCRNATSRPREAGLSLFEVLIALVIASLLLGAVLPMAGRSMAQNLRLAELSLRAEDADLDEVRFRALAASAYQRPPSASNLMDVNIVTGGPDGFEFFAIAARPVPCLELGQAALIRVSVERSPQGQRLICSGPTGSEPLTGWMEAISGFLYSDDGLRWRNDWPKEDDLEAPPQPPAPIDFEATAPLPTTIAPLVSASLSSGKGVRRQRLWVVRVGDTRPLRLVPDFGN